MFNETIGRGRPCAMSKDGCTVIRRKWPIAIFLVLNGRAERGWSRAQYRGCGFRGAAARDVATEKNGVG
jgi:hypothetical protein